MALHTAGPTDRRATLPYLAHPTSLITPLPLLPYLPLYPRYHVYTMQASYLYAYERPGDEGAEGGGTYTIDSKPKPKPKPNPNPNPHQVPIPSTRWLNMPSLLVTSCRAT